MWTESLKSTAEINGVKGSGGSCERRQDKGRARIREEAQLQPTAAPLHHKIRVALLE